MYQFATNSHHFTFSKSTEKLNLTYCVQFWSLFHGHYHLFYRIYHSINRKGNKRKEVVGRNTNFVLLVIYVTICHRKVICARNALVYTSMQRPMDCVMETHREPWSGPERALDWPMETHGLGHSLCSLLYGSLWASPRLGSRDPWTGPQIPIDKISFVA